MYKTNNLVKSIGWLCVSLAGCASSPQGPSDAQSIMDVTMTETSNNLPDAPPGTHLFRFVNRCSFTVWVASSGNPVSPNNGGWELTSGSQNNVYVPTSWRGRFWPRTGCANFNTTGQRACESGDCGGRLECPANIGGAPPVTLAEFALDAFGGVDFYDVSAVDGASIGLQISAIPGTFAPAPNGSTDRYYCTSPGCTTNCGLLPACPWNLASTCPAELRIEQGGRYVGCRSANQACAVNPNNPALNCQQNRDLYGCTGGGPNNVSGSCYSPNAQGTCCGCPSWSEPGSCNAHNPLWELPALPERYAKILKDACPTAYSFPYDDPTSTFTCRGNGTTLTGYEITFCP